MATILQMTFSNQIYWLKRSFIFIQISLKFVCEGLVYIVLGNGFMQNIGLGNGFMQNRAWAVT